MDFQSSRFCSRLHPSTPAPIETCPQKPKEKATPPPSNLLASFFSSLNNFLVKYEMALRKTRLAKKIIFRSYV